MASTAAAVLAVFGVLVVAIVSSSGQPATAAAMTIACKDCATYCDSSCSGSSSVSSSCSGICSPATLCVQNCKSVGFAQCTNGCRNYCTGSCGVNCDCAGYCSNSCSHVDYDTGCNKSCCPSPQQCQDRVIQQCKDPCTTYCNNNCVKA